MHGLPADFLAVVQPTVLACRTNSLFEVESLDGTAFAINQLYSLKADKFFLLSRPEIFGNWDSESYKDGTQLEYYNGLTATERIKRDAAGAARYAWLRSPNPSDANYARIVNSSGEVNNNNAYNGNGVAPDCGISQYSSSRKTKAAQLTQGATVLTPKGGNIAGDKGTSRGSPFICVRFSYGIRASNFL